MAVIAPFNFPLEIITMQVMGALFMGNKVLAKPNKLVGLPFEQMMRLLFECGLPKEDVDIA